MVFFASSLALLFARWVVVGLALLSGRLVCFGLALLWDNPLEAGVGAVGGLVLGLWLGWRLHVPNSGL